MVDAFPGGGGRKLPRARRPRQRLSGDAGLKREVGQRLDTIIEAAVPNVRKAVKWNSPFYGAPDQIGWFLSFHVFTRYVKVTFFRGTALDPGPGRQVEASQCALPRHLRGTARRNPVRRMGEASQGSDWGEDVTSIRRGPAPHPGSANSNPANSNAGATMQEMSAYPTLPSDAVAADSTQPAGIIICGCSPMTICPPSRAALDGPTSDTAIDRSTGSPPCHSQTSSASTRFQWDRWPAWIRYSTALAARALAWFSSAAKIFANQPPSGMGREVQRPDQLVRLHLDALFSLPRIASRRRIPQRRANAVLFRCPAECCN